MRSGGETRTCPGKEKALGADWELARGRTDGESVYYGADGLCAPSWRLRGGGASPVSPLPQPPPAASTARTFPPEVRPVTSRLPPGFLAPSLATEEGRAFERARCLSPAAGSFGDALVGTGWGGLDQDPLSPRALLFPLGWGEGGGDRGDCFCYGAFGE